MPMQQIFLGGGGAGLYEGYIAVAHGTSPFINVYPWTSGTGFGTKYADPSTLPTSTGMGVAFSPDGADLACLLYTSPSPRD